MKYETIKIVKEELYCSKSMVNVTDNMVRITLICSRNEWHELKRHLIPVEADAEGCADVGDCKWVDGFCHTCTYFKPCTT